MGDKSPKSKRREQEQKNAAKTQTKNDQAQRQASFGPPKEAKDKRK